MSLVSKLWNNRYELNHAIISYNQKIYFKDTSIYEDVFNKMVMQGIDKRCIKEKIIYIDSSHIRVKL